MFYPCPNPPGRAPILTELIGDFSSFLIVNESRLLLLYLVLSRKVFKHFLNNS